jgi:hypothetical protein
MPRPDDAVRLNSYRLQAEREDLAGELTTVSGYLTSAGMIGHNVCLKVLVDETLRFAPDILIANRGRASEPSADLRRVYHHADPRHRATRSSAEGERRELTVTVEEDEAASRGSPLLGWMGRVLPGSWSTGVSESHRLPTVRRETLTPAEPRPPASPVAKRDTIPDLRVELEKAESYLEGRAPAANLRRAAVVQACKRPPTRTNRKALEHALLWLAPLGKPERIQNAPSLATLRRELQLHYLDRSRAYDWAPLTWEEVILTGRLLDEDAIFEDEVIGGVDMIPLILGVHDAQRETWLFIDLSSGESIPREFMMGLLREGAPSVLRKAGGAALRGGLP